MADNSRDEVLSRVLAQLFEGLGIDALAREKQDDIKLKITELLFKHIFLETMEKLSEQGREEYGKMLDDGTDSAKMEVFLKERISGYDEILKRVAERFKADMTGSEF